MLSANLGQYNLGEIELQFKGQPNGFGEYQCQQAQIAIEIEEVTPKQVGFSNGLVSLQGGQNTVVNFERQYCGALLFHPDKLDNLRFVALERGKLHVNGKLLCRLSQDKTLEAPFELSIEVSATPFSFNATFEAVK